MKNQDLLKELRACKSLLGHSIQELSDSDERQEPEAGDDDKEKELFDMFASGCGFEDADPLAIATWHK